MNTETENNVIPPPIPLSGYEKWKADYYASIAARPPGTPFPLGHPSYDQSKDPIFNPSLRKDETPKLNEPR